MLANSTAGSHKEGCSLPLGRAQARAFQRLKDLCCKAPEWAYYHDVKKETTIQCDASKNAVGAVLLQEGRRVAYASCKLRKSELK